MDKSIVERYKCHKLGRFQSDCPEWDKDANYVEHDDTEEMVLMAQTEECNPTKRYTWFFDSGCSNHMTGDKQWFCNINEDYRNKVRLGNDVRVVVMGKGNVRFEIEEAIHVLTDVYFVPDLRNNLIRVMQIQEKGATVLMKDGFCSVYHPRKGLIIKTPVTANRMYLINASPSYKVEKESKCSLS